MTSCLREAVLAVLKQADYDLWKSLNPATAEDPDDAEEELERLVEVLKKSLDHQA